MPECFRPASARRSSVCRRPPARCRPCRCGTRPCRPCTRATVLPTSGVTVPARGEGISPRGPSTLPSGPTSFIMSGAAMQASNSVQPPLIFSARSSSPTTSAPAAFGLVGLRALGEHDHSLLLADAVRQHDRAADDLLGLRVVDAQPDRDLDRLVELRAFEALERLHRVGHGKCVGRLASSQRVPDIVWIVLPCCLIRCLVSGVSCRIASLTPDT